MNSPNPPNLLARLAQADRNEQVRILRLSAQRGGDTAAQAHLLGLHAGERRVREVAIKGSVPYLDNPAVVERLAAIAADGSEKRKLRQAALSALCGYPPGATERPLPAPAAAALAPFIEKPETRAYVTLGLARLPLNPPVEGLLRRIVALGTPEEAALAERALAGEKIVNLGSFDAEERARIAATHDPAAGRVYFWVPRQEAPAAMGA